MGRIKRILPKRAGRGARGRIAVRHQGGRHKRFLREIDFKRQKEIPARVEAIEYEPNRTANVVMLLYEDGERRYALAPEGLKVGDKIQAGENVPVKLGNTLPLSKIPVGTSVHNLEITPGKGGQIARGAGNAAIIQGKDKKEVIVKLPSGEVRKFAGESKATVGQVQIVEKRRLGKAGARRHMGIRPTVRGVAMHPGAHPHGGGEGRSPVGMPSPKTPWGKKARGVKTRKVRKYSDKFLVQTRKGQIV